MWVRKILIVNEVGGTDLIEKVAFGQRLEHRKEVKRGFQDEGAVNATPKPRRERATSA